MTSTKIKHTYGKEEATKLNKILTHMNYYLQKMETKILTDEEGTSLADDLICAFKHRDGSIMDESVLRFIDQLLEKSFLPETSKGLFLAKRYWSLNLRVKSERSIHYFDNLFSSVQYQRGLHLSCYTRIVEFFDMNGKIDFFYHLDMVGIDESEYKKFTDLFVKETEKERLYQFEQSTSIKIECELIVADNQISMDKIWEAIHLGRIERYKDIAQKIYDKLRADRLGLTLDTLSISPSYQLTFYTIPIKHDRNSEDPSSQCSPRG